MAKNSGKKSHQQRADNAGLGNPKRLDFESFVRAAMQTGRPPKPAKKVKERKSKK
jgi:hypothetical protein